MMRPDLIERARRGDREAFAELAALGTSCPDHFLRTKVRPLVLDLPPSASIEEATTRLRELHLEYREDYAAASVPMLPSVATSAEVAKQIVLYSWVMVGTSLALWPITPTGSRRTQDV